MSKRNWKEYYTKAQKSPPPKLLLKALEYMGESTEKPRVLELGAGSMRDVLYLLEGGFAVHAVDRSPGSLDLSKTIEDDNFTFDNVSFKDMDLGDAHFNVIFSNNSLSFMDDKEELKAFMTRLKDRLVAGGILAVNFFGLKDSWSSESRDMVFVTKEEVEEMIVGLEVLDFDEREKDAETASGTMKHWHVYEVIAKKGSTS